MRILIILENYYPRIGGVETFFKSLVDTLDGQGHTVTVLTNRYDKSLKEKEQFGQNITVIRKSFFNRYLFTFFAWWPALKLARNADIIHTTSYNAAVPAWMAAKLSGTISIITFHERYGDLWDRLPWMSSPAKFLHKYFESFITKLGFDKFVGVSDFTKNSLLEAGIEPSRVVRIYNGIEYDAFPVHEKSNHHTPYTFMFYGRVGHAKGLDILLKGYQLLIESGKREHQLILVLPSEQTPLFRNVTSLIKDYKIADQVSIHHDLTYAELIHKIATVDCIVIPSYSEGFCYAAAETMAIGTPIISSGQGALAEVVSGQYIQMKDQTPLALSQAMMAALNDQWFNSEKRRFPLVDTIQSYLDLYQELASH